MTRPTRPRTSSTAADARSASTSRTPTGVETLLELVDGADALVEGFRPGVAERLGFGPDVCLARNPRLVYGRMTGWGQDGPYAQAAGHDINYIALAGALRRRSAGPARRPIAPLNLVGDFGGGGMLLAFGIVCALVEAKRSGEGQVVDAAMVDGVGPAHDLHPRPQGHGRLDRTRGAPTCSTPARHFYDVYECADGEYVSIGSIEPQFYAELLASAAWPATSPTRWTVTPGPRCKDALTEVMQVQDP